MNCFMFPGQPLSHDMQPPDDDDFRQIAQLTSKHIGLNIYDFTWNSEQMTESVALQVYGAAISLYRARRLSREGSRPNMIAEHSMGIYSALSVSGSIPEGDALELTFRIGRRMARMSDTMCYALGCVVGLPLEPLLAVCENNGVHMANHNTSRHFLLSGELSGIESAATEALGSGAFSAKVFPCDAPLHTPLMENIGGSLREIISDYRFEDPSVPLMNHIDQDFLVGAEVGDFLLRELFLPVYWEKTYLALRAAGINRFVEVGAGDALKKYNRWIESETARS